MQAPKPNFIRLSFLIILLSATFTTTAQKKVDIVGTWNITGFGKTEFFIDIKSKQITVPPNSEIDTARLQGLKDMFISNAPTGKYIFKKDKSYLEISDGKTASEGTYNIDHKQRTISLSGKRNGLKINEVFKYEMDGATLVLKQEKEDDNFIFRLEKE